MRLNMAGLLPAAASLVLTLLFSGPAIAQGWRNLGGPLEGRELVMRPTPEERRKVYLNLGEAEMYALYRGDRLFPLREGEPVRITGTDRSPFHIELRIESGRLGSGQVEFHGSPPTALEFERWLDAVFEVLTPEADFHRYIGNRQSRMLHIRGANHLPPASDREPFSAQDAALDAGYRRCGACFVPTSVPTPIGFGRETERVPPASNPLVDRVARRVLDEWPVPLRGYRYQFQVVDNDDLDAHAFPTGQIFMTRGLLEATETEAELAAILAHEIAHVESGHTYRIQRNMRNWSMWMNLLLDVDINRANTPAAWFDDPVSSLIAFGVQRSMSGHEQDREREADLFASFYLDSQNIGDQPLLNVFRKLKFAAEAHNPFGESGGMFASHPHIDERLARASTTRTERFPPNTVFYGTRRDGTLVAMLRFDVQRLYRNHLDVVVTLLATEALGKPDDVGTLTLRMAGQPLKLGERTAEKIFPGTAVSAIFGTDRAGGLIEGPFSASLKLRNVDRWANAIPRSAP